MALVQWFLSAGFSRSLAEEYARLVSEQDISVDQLHELDHELLKEIGIKKIGHRLTVLTHANKQDVPLVGVVLGTGLGDVVKKMTDTKSLPYSEIPYFPKPTATGHVGTMTVGKLGGKNVVALKGRTHYYENGNLQDVIYAIRVLKVWGIQKIIMVSACGSLSDEILPGDLVFVDHHINLIPNPLVGPNISELGPRWPHGKDPYNIEDNIRGMEFANSLGTVKAWRGVYIGISGPSGSTRAELKAYRTLGADVLGYSTTPEVICCAHMGLPVQALGVVIDSVAPDSAFEVADEECFRMAGKMVPALEKIVESLISVSVPKIDTNSTLERVPDLVFKANVAYHNLQYTSALHFYKLALSKETEQNSLWNIHNRLCATYSKLGDLEKGLEEATILTTSNPKMAKGFVRKAGILKSLGKFKDAVQNYEKAIEILGDGKEISAKTKKEQVCLWLAETKSLL